MPTGSSFDSFTQGTIDLIFSQVNAVKRRQFQGKSAYDMFSFVYSRELAEALATARRNAYSVIVISNSCDVRPKTSGTHLVTSKENKSAHGFGLKSVRKTLRKYNGDYEWTYDANRCMFVVTAMIGSHL